MIDDKADPQSVEKAGQVSDDVAGRVKLQMPTKRFHPRLRLQYVRLDFRQRQTRALEQIETHGSYAAPMEILEFRILDVRLDHRDAARRVADHIEGIQQTGIVGTVKTRLNDDEALHADDRHERLILSEISIRQGVMRFRDVRIPLRRTKDVNMDIPRAGRHCERGTRYRLERPQRPRNLRLFAHRTP